MSLCLATSLLAVACEGVPFTAEPSSPSIPAAHGDVPKVVSLPPEKGEIATAPPSSAPVTEPSTTVEETTTTPEPSTEAPPSLEDATQAARRRGRTSTSTSTTAPAPAPAAPPATAAPTTAAPTTTTTTAGPAGNVLLRDTFDGADGLITNEYAFYSPSDGRAVRSATWEMTSGSLFRQAGTGWSGPIDDSVPNVGSTSGTNSAIFRLTSVRNDFRDVSVSMRLRINGFTTTGSTPATDWDGIHVFLRYQSEYNLYYASVDRRDGAVVLKKKCAGGSSNGGTYYTLGSTGRDALPIGGWADVSATVVNLPDGRVQLRVMHAGRVLSEAIDNGVGCAAITNAGAVGVRGDNVDFNFDDFTVTTAS